LKFYEVQPALESGKKIKRGNWNFGHLIISGNTICALFQGNCYSEYDFRARDILADDWEIIEDIPQIKLFRSKDIFFICPKCQRHQEQLVYSEDRDETVHTCRHCGQKYRFSNLDEMKRMLNDNPKSFEEILKEHGLFDLWKSETQKVLESDDIWVSWTNYTKEEAKKIVDKVIRDYENYNAASYVHLADSSVYPTLKRGVGRR